MGDESPLVHALGRARRSAGARMAVAALGLAVLIAGLAPAAAAQTGSGVVSIRDRGLRAAIEQALGKQPGDVITESEMAGLSALDASYSGVGSIEGLEHAVHLRSLHLAGNRISDVSSLSSLTRMQVLVLHDNDISEIDLTGMTDLRFVDLGNNELAAIDLSGQRTGSGENPRASKLYALWLHGNRLASVDLSGLSALRDRADGTSHPNFVSLRLDGNQLTAVAGLDELPREVWSLRLERNQLTSLDLRGAEHLHYLYLNDNPISSTSDLAGFSGLSDLRRLHLYGTDISSIDLSAFPGLERAFLNDNNLSSIDVTGLDSILRLWLRGNRLTSIDGLDDIGDTLVALNLRTNRLDSVDLSGLRALRQLYLSDNQLTSIDVSSLRRLEVLWVDNGVDASRGSAPDPAYQNRLATLGELPRWLTELRLTGLPLASPLPVSSRTYLRKLYVSGGQVSGLSEVTGLTGLTELGLRDMGLTSADLSSLSRLSALERLDLRDNLITDVSPVASFSRMVELRLDGNTVRDVAPLSVLAGLRDLHVARNHIADFGALRRLVEAGLRIHGGDEQRGESPDNFFWDLDAAGSVHGWSLSRLAADGILDNTECGLDLICPNLVLERWVVAIWLVRVLDGGDPEPLGHSRFEDVHPGLQWAAHVERLADLGVTAGCSSSPAQFCPRRPVTRAHMASLLARAFNLESDTPAGFDDVSRDNPHAAGIDAVAAAGIAGGCAAGPDHFCPDDLVRRGQAATLINRAVDHVGGN